MILDILGNINLGVLIPSFACGWLYSDLRIAKKEILKVSRKIDLYRLDTDDKITNIDNRLFDLDCLFNSNLYHAEKINK